VVVGDRIAQLVFQRYVEANIFWGGKDVPKEATTERGDGGFGSTGIGEL
jgi:dUTPase